MFHVKHSRQKFLEKSIDFLKFLARGRQCESEVQIRLVLRPCGCVYGGSKGSLRGKLRKIL